MLSITSPARARPCRRDSSAARLSTTPSSRGSRSKPRHFGRDVFGLDAEIAALHLAGLDQLIHHLRDQR